MRNSINLEVNGKVKDGFDYDLQVWVKNYIIQKCGHPKAITGICCHVKGLAGKDVRTIK